MAAITITRGLSALTSAFNQQSIEFTITAAVVPTTTLNSIEFKPTKTVDNVGGLDTYVLDITDMIPYILGFPPDNYTDVSLYRKLLTVSISGAGAITQTTSTYLCFAVDKIAEAGSLVADIIAEGRRFASYNNGNIGFYFNGTAGTYTANIGAFSESVSLVNGYNILTPTGNISGKSGLFSITGTDIEFNVVYKPLTYSQTFNKLVKWINKDGSYSEWDFRLITTENDVKSSNRIPNYKQTMSEIKYKSKEISKEKTRTFILDTIAVDVEHYAQLVDIASSPVVYYADLVLKVSDSNKSVAECKQNLKFNLSLQIEDYVATY